MPRTAPPFVIASFATDDYAAQMDRLTGSLAAAGYRGPRRLVKGYPSKGSWLANCGQKATFLRATMNQYKMPVLWIDADAEVLADPAALAPVVAGCDVAAYLPRAAPGRVTVEAIEAATAAPTCAAFPLVGSRLLSGTIYFAYTVSTLAVLAEWEALCAQRPGHYDQEILYEVLTRAIPRDGLRVNNLPPGWVCIEDLMVGVRALITHHQASRKLRGVA